MRFSCHPSADKSFVHNTLSRITIWKYLLIQGKKACWFTTNFPQSWNWLKVFWIIYERQDLLSQIIPMSRFSLGNMLDTLEALRIFITFSSVWSQVKYCQINLPLKNVINLWLFYVSTELYTEWYYNDLNWTVLYNYQKCWNFDLESSILTVVWKWHYFHIFTASQSSVFDIVIKTYSKEKQIPNLVLRTGASRPKCFKY